MLSLYLIYSWTHPQEWAYSESQTLTEHTTFLTTSLHTGVALYVLALLDLEEMRLFFSSLSFLFMNT